MKIRILSDLHLDYNRDDVLTLKNKNIFTIIAGDLSGYSHYREEWLKKNIRKGLFVEGNHIFYNNDQLTLQEHYRKLKKEYPLDNDLSFLQNDHKIINDIVFVGCTLWTDCKLYGREYINDLPKIMNDYRYGLYEDINGQSRKFTPKDSINEFNQSIKYIDSICHQYPTKKIVIITHHCPSIKCISKHYRTFSDCNHAYASNLENFILEHNNIEAWICGHSHNQADFKIGNCRVIMNCRGYVNRQESICFNPEKTIYI